MSINAFFNTDRLDQVVAAAIVRFSYEGSRLFHALNTRLNVYENRAFDTVLDASKKADSFVLFGGGEEETARAWKLRETPRNFVWYPGTAVWDGELRPWAKFANPETAKTALASAVWDDLGVGSAPAVVGMADELAAKIKDGESLAEIENYFVLGLSTRVTDPGNDRAFAALWQPLFGDMHGDGKVFTSVVRDGESVREAELEAAKALAA